MILSNRRHHGHYCSPKIYMRIANAHRAPTSCMTLDAEGYCAAELKQLITEGLGVCGNLCIPPAKHSLRVQPDVNFLGIMQNGGRVLSLLLFDTYLDPFLRPTT
jgi:hypothetical protein